LITLIERVIDATNDITLTETLRGEIERLKTDNSTLSQSLQTANDRRVTDVSQLEEELTQKTQLITDITAQRYDCVDTFSYASIVLLTPYLEKLGELHQWRLFCNNYQIHPTLTLWFRSLSVTEV